MTFNYLNDDWIRVLLGVHRLRLRRLATCSPACPHPPSRAAGRATPAPRAPASPASSRTRAARRCAIYLLPMRLDKALYVGTTIIFFTAINAAKIVPYLMLGLFDARNLGTAVALLPIAVVGILFGIWLRQRLSTMWFYRIAYTLMFVTGAKLLCDGVTHLLAG